MNSPGNMDPDDAVNMNDECREQWLELENIVFVCLSISQPIVVIPFKPCMLANNRSPIINVKVIAGGSYIHLGISTV